MVRLQKVSCPDTVARRACAAQRGWQHQVDPEDWRRIASLQNVYWKHEAMFYGTELLF
jgi:hypothetical protein